ncbi:MAG: methylmalonyl-CoA carboxyltransferase [Desulfobacterales bacterium]|nr:methylmalonyl-CoA carboxyltransferase [Desulfobacterales bacterium]
MSTTSTKEKIADLKERHEQLAKGGGDKAISVQHEKGKLTARERIDIIFDTGTFKEVDVFVTHRSNFKGMQGVNTPSDGVVTGYGTVNGRLVFIYAQDFTVMGGSLGEMHEAKITKVQDMALKMGAPIIGISDSGGARIQEGVSSLIGLGNMFYRNTIASGVIPQISIIMGPSAGGAVYSPALTDFVFMVDGSSKMFITGPQVIKTVTGEQVDAETLGGSVTHNRTSGVAHFRSANDQECLETVKELLSFLPSNNLDDPPVFEAPDDLNRINPALDDIVPDSANKSYDMRDIIAGIVDNGHFFQVHKEFAQNVLTVFARLNGKTVGIIANQPMHLAGCLDINASDKAARFIRFCDAFNIPLLTLVDVPGYLPGSIQEFNGIIRHGAKVLYAYAEATVPKVTLVIRKGYGGGYIAMCNKGLGADQVFAWPTAEIAVMGPEGAANIIYRKEIKAADNPDEKRREMVEEYRTEFANPYSAATFGYVEDVIQPAQSRPILISSFEMLENKSDPRPAKKHGNMPL